MSHVKNFDEMNPEQQFAYLVGKRSMEAVVVRLQQERDEDRKLIAGCGESLKAVLAEVARLQQEREEAHVALREMLGSYEALAGCAIATAKRAENPPYGVWTKEQLMNWDGPVCARRVLGVSPDKPPEGA